MAPYAISALCTALILVALTFTATATATGGGVGLGGSQKTVAGKKAKLKKNGKAVPPKGAPKRVKRAIKAANKIVGKPYGAPNWTRWKSSQFDCSAAISYAIGKKGAKILKTPTWSGPLMKWGKKGKGKWITVYSNPGHAYVMIAGLRFESRKPGDGPKWRKMKATKRDWSGNKYAIRHKKGL